MTTDLQNLQRVTDLFGIGTYSNFLKQRLASACYAVGADGRIKVAGVLDYKRGANDQFSGFGRNGVADISPRLEDIPLSAGGMTRDAFIREFQHRWEPLLVAMAQACQQLHSFPLLLDPEVLLLTGLTSGQYLIFKRFLELLRERLRFAHIAVLSVIGDQADKRPLSVRGYDRLARLHAQRQIDVTLLIDNLSPLALKLSLQVQDRFVATALASAFRAQPFGVRAVAFGEMAYWLGRVSPFIGMRFSSHRLPAGKESSLWRAFRQIAYPLLHVPIRGWAPAMDTLLTETKLAVGEAITDPAAQAIEASFDPRRPFYAILTVPLPSWGRRERSVWIEYSNQVSHWLTRAYPQAVLMLAPGNGTAHTLDDPDAWIQSTVVFPIVGEPKEIQDLRHSAPKGQEGGEDGDA